MNDESNHNGKNEIIIVRRSADNHDGHHGGGWKIAYADFMTAMMAFFLVMWLINAANEETKAAIAAYFNPVQLTDQKPAEKGLKDPAKDAQGEQTQQRSKVDGEQTKSGGSAKTGDQLTATSGEETKYSDADFFENPYSVLSEIAREVGHEANISVKGDGGAAQSGPSTGAAGGEAYRDPFDPDFWTKQVEVKDAGNTAESDVASAANSAREAASAPNVPDKAEGAKAADAPENQAPAENPQKEAEALKAEIEKELGGEAGRLLEGLAVTPAEGGLLVTISEQTDAPMFAVGSAVRKRSWCSRWRRSAGCLPSARASGGSRSYRWTAVQGWHLRQLGLSAARAQSAYYMLVRGGLEEERVKQISGFADRRLQVPNDAYAPANRRIEILLQSGQG